MNAFDFGYMPYGGGFIAYYRMVHHSRNFVLRDGRHDIIFATSREAYEAAGEAFKAYLNSPISGMTSAQDSNWDKGNALFNLVPTERPKVIKQRGKGRPIQVIRTGVEA